MTDQEQNRDNFLSTASQAAQKKDMDTLERCVTGFAASPQADSLIPKIGSQWPTVAQRSQKQKRSSQILFGVIILVCIVFAYAAGWYVHSRILVPNPTVDGEVTQPAVVGQPVETEEVVAPPTPTATPEPTQPLTEMPTPTAVPPTPTMIADSGFLITDTVSISPAIPVRGANTWLLEGDAIRFVSRQGVAGWQVSEPAQEDQTGYAFLVNYSGSPPTRVVWAMDEPFQGDGLYGLYYLDTVSDSMGSFDFQVLINNVVVQPEYGLNRVFLYASSDVDREHGQVQNAWRSFGIYEFLAGEKLDVEIQMPPLTADSANSFAVGPVLVVKLSDMDATILAGEGSNLYSNSENNSLWMTVLDDSAIDWTCASGPCQIQARLPENQDTEANWFSVPAQWQLVSREFSWLGSYFQLTSVENVIYRISWPAVRVPAGTYAMMVWTPIEFADSTAKFDIIGAERLGGEDMGLLVQPENRGAWVEVGKWRVIENGFVTVSAARDANQTDLSWAVDAVALIRIDE